MKVRLFNEKTIKVKRKVDDVKHSIHVFMPEKLR